MNSPLISSGRKMCYFFPWTPVKPYFYVTVQKDSSYIHKIVQLQSFYFNEFIPHILKQGEQHSFCPVHFCSRPTALGSSCKLYEIFFRTTTFHFSQLMKTSLSPTRPRRAIRLRWRLIFAQDSVLMYQPRTIIWNCQHLGGRGGGVYMCTQVQKCIQPLQRRCSHCFNV